MLGERARAGIVAAATMVAGCLWHVAPAAASALVGTGTLVVVAMLVPLQTAVERARRTSRAATIAGVRVHVVDGRSAWTAGPLCPRIFVGKCLVADLEPLELRAVVLHEQAHRRAWDPLRLALSRPLPVVLATRLATRREIRADLVAIARGVERSSLAAALLRVQPPTAATAAAVGFTPAANARVKALVDPAIAAPRRGLTLHAFAVVSGVAGCLTVGHRLLMLLS